MGGEEGDHNNATATVAEAEAPVMDVDVDVDVDVEEKEQEGNGGTNQDAEKGEEFNIDNSLAGGGSGDKVGDALGDGGHDNDQKNKSCSPEEGDEAAVPPPPPPPRKAPSPAAAAAATLAASNEEQEQPGDERKQAPPSPTHTGARILPPDVAPHPDAEILLSVGCSDYSYHWAVHEGKATQYYPSVMWRTKAVDDADLQSDEPNCFVLPKYLPDQVLATIFGDAFVDGGAKDGNKPFFPKGESSSIESAIKESCHKRYPIIPLYVISNGDCRHFSRLKFMFRHLPNLKMFVLDGRKHFFPRNPTSQSEEKKKDENCSDSDDDDDEGTVSNDVHMLSCAKAASGLLVGLPCLVIDASTYYQHMCLDITGKICGSGILPGIQLQIETLVDRCKSSFDDDENNLNNKNKKITHNELMNVVETCRSEKKPLPFLSSDIRQSAIRSILAANAQHLWVTVKAWLNEASKEVENAKKAEGGASAPPPNSFLNTKLTVIVTGRESNLVASLLQPDLSFIVKIPPMSVPALFKLKQQDHLSNLGLKALLCDHAVALTEQQREREKRKMNDIEKEKATAAAAVIDGPLSDTVRENASSSVAPVTSTKDSISVKTDEAEKLWNQLLGQRVVASTTTKRYRFGTVASVLKSKSKRKKKTPPSTGDGAAVGILFDDAPGKEENFSAKELHDMLLMYASRGESWIERERDSCRKARLEQKKEDAKLAAAKLSQCVPSVKQQQLASSTNLPASATTTATGGSITNKRPADAAALASVKKAKVVAEPEVPAKAAGDAYDTTIEPSADTNATGVALAQEIAVTAEGPSSSTESKPAAGRTTTEEPVTGVDAAASPSEKASESDAPPAELAPQPESSATATAENAQPREPPPDPVNDPASVVNCRIAKYFPDPENDGYKLYYGTITDYSPPSDNEEQEHMWHVFYEEDEDNEDMFLTDVQRGMKLYARNQDKDPMKNDNEQQ